MKNQRSLLEVVNASKVTAAENDAAMARAQLEAERRAHSETVKALERSRFAKAPKKITPATSKAGTGDIVEVIFSDVHGNKHDPAAMAAFLGDLRTLRPDRLIIGGDFIDCGGFLAEHHTLGYVAETEDSYEEDVAVSNSLLDQILAAASPSEVHYVEGNHEWRVERWALTQRLAHHKDVDLLRRTFCPEHVLRLKDRGIRYYRQGQTHGDCNTPGWVKIDKAFFVHKISNARDAAGQAMAKAAGNIVFFDTHRAAFKPMHLPGVGLISAWNPGCLCKRQPLYANTRPTEWTHGYLVRFISRKTGNFQMTNITINEGTSYASLLLKPKTP